MVSNGTKMYTIKLVRNNLGVLKKGIKSTSLRETPQFTERLYYLLQKIYRFLFWVSLRLKFKVKVSYITRFFYISMIQTEG